MTRFIALLLVSLVPQIALAADVTVFEEFLNDGDANTSGFMGTMGAGSFVADGWKTTSVNSQIRYDLDKTGQFPDGLACGTVELTFSNFDPTVNFHGGTCGMCPSNHNIFCTDTQCPKKDASACNECYVNTLGIYESVEGNAHTAGPDFETFLNLHAMNSPIPVDADRNKCLKFMSRPWSDKKVTNAYLPPKGGQDKQDWHALAAQGAVFTAKLSWTCGGVSYLLTRDINGVKKDWSWNAKWDWTGDTDPLGPKPRIQYVFVGRDNSKQLWLGEVVYRTLTVSEQVPCDCAQVTDGGTPDAGGHDAGVADAGGQDTGHHDAGAWDAAEDSGGKADAGQTEDAGTPDGSGGLTDTGAPADAGARKDAGAGRDSGDAGFDEYDTVGCGCTMLSVE